MYGASGCARCVLDTEIDGFVADRLLEALWREALWLVNDGVATVEQIDDAIRFGAGLRWSFMGTFLVYRIAGGEAGMRHFMAQFGPALQWPWTKLTDVPELTDELLERIVEQSDEQAGGRVDPRAGGAARRLPRRRDAGSAQRRLTAPARCSREYEQSAVRPRSGARRRADDSAPLRLRTHETASPPTGSTTTATPTTAATRSCRATHPTRLLRLIGMDADYLAGGHSWFTAESHITYVAQSRAGDPVYVTTQVLAHDPKRLHVFNRMYRSATGDDGDELIATGEHLYLHVDTQAERVVPAPPEMIAHIAAIADAHASLERPPQAGRFVGAPRE